jgi:hypothetical protein
MPRSFAASMSTTFVTGRGDADVFQLRHRFNLRAMQHRLVRDDNLCVCGACGDFTWRRTVEDFARAERLEFVPAQVAGVQRVAVEDNDVHFNPICSRRG